LKLKRRLHKLPWLWRRLRAMPPGELLYRLQLSRRDAGRRKALRRRTPPPQGGPRAGVIPASSLDLPTDRATRSGASLPASAVAPRHDRFWWNDDRVTDLATELDRHCLDAVAAVIRDAERIVSGEVLLFRDWVRVGPSPDWHTDPLGGDPWPRDFAGDIDLRTPGHGGIRRVWELNRHHEFTVLAQAFALTRDERYATKLRALWEGWLADNPLDIGVNWTSGLEMAIRVMNWAWAWALLDRGGALPDALSAGVIQAIVEQARWIEEHPSLYSTANNHRIGEAVALAVVGLLWPALPRAKHWLHDGLAALSEEVPRQISADGVALEQAFHYQAFVLDACLWVLDLLHRAEAPRPAALAERVRTAAGFLRTVMDTRGDIPAVGDSDEGWFLRFGGVSEARYRGLLQVAAVTFGDAALNPDGDAPDPQLFWRLGLPGLSAHASLCHARTPRGSRAFADGGYAVFRCGTGSDERVGTFDCGPLGMGTLAAHGHADALSLTVSVGGRPALIDAGTYGYHEQPEWRPYFRGTAAHNTVRIDGRDQSEIGGPFLWTRHAHARLERWNSSPALDLAQAGHDGYAALGVRHQRSVLFRKPDTWILVDTLLGTGEHQIEQRFHLAPGAVDVDGDHLRVAGAGLTIVGASIPGLLLSTHQGVEQPREGWYSPRFGHREPATAVIYERPGPLPVTLATVVSVGEGPCEVSLLPAANEGVVLRLAYRGVTDWVALAGSAHACLETEELRVKGELAWLRVDAASEPLWLGGLHLSGVEWQRRVLHAGPAAIVDRITWEVWEPAGRPAPEEGNLACH
jgi:Heparinase II/III-like protein/Heparinase II/III N-terminus